MNVELADGLTGDVDGRRSGLEHAFLNVQTDRVALTDSFIQLEEESGAVGIDALIVRLLRLQRAVEMARDLVRPTSEEA